MSNLEQRMKKNNEMMVAALELARGIFETEEDFASLEKRYYELKAEYDALLSEEIQELETRKVSLTFTKEHWELLDMLKQRESCSWSKVFYSAPYRFEEKHD